MLLLLALVLTNAPTVILQKTNGESQTFIFKIDATNPKKWSVDLPSWCEENPEICFGFERDSMIEYPFNDIAAYLQQSAKEFFIQEFMEQGLEPNEFDVPCMCEGEILGEEQLAAKLRSLPVSGTLRLTISAQPKTEQVSSQRR